MLARLLLCAIVMGLFSSREQSALGGESRPVLDSYSYWRGHLTFRPVVLAEKSDGASTPAGYPRTDAPPAAWMAPDFDDGRWFRMCGPVFGGGPNGWGSFDAGGGSHSISMVCLRGRFAVDDPAAVKSLTLAATYRGGIVVYLNGKEVVRRHLKDGDLTADSIATEYPWETFVSTKGRATIKARLKKLSAEDRKRLDLRLRNLADVALPTDKLRKGVNVIAIELHRAPVHPDSLKLKEYWKYGWTSAALPTVKLTASPAASIASNTQRPAGVQVWNEDVFADVYDVDYGDTNEPLRPIHLVGVRNGAFSGQIAIGSNAPLQGVSAEISELKTKDGKAVISAEHIRVQYPLPNELKGTGAKAEKKGKWFRGIGSGDKVRLDALVDSPPAEVPVRTTKVQKGHAGLPQVPGAVQSVRFTVEVPADASPGEYRGSLTVEAEGLAETTVPVSIEVIDWTLPDSREFTSHLGIVQSVDGIAFYYGVPLWSERHWKLIDRSFAILGRAGVDALYMPLVMKYHWGREGLVRWIKNEDGSFSHDFSLFEKYLDTALKHLKDPDVVCLIVWERAYRAWIRRTKLNERRKKRLEEFLKSGPPHPIVPLLDPKTGEVSELKAPVYTDPKTVEFWKPVLDGCWERLMKRGIKKEAVLLGQVPDGHPAPEAVDFFHQAAPWGKWVQLSHAPGSKFKGVKVDQVPVYHAAGVYGGTRPIPDPAEKRYYGWKPYNKNTEMFCVFPRTGSPYRLGYDTTLSMFHVFQEVYMMTGMRGIAKVGAEFWPLTLSDGGKQPKEGEEKRKTLLISAYSINIPSMKLSVYDFLAPGKDGALSTVRLETLYEGAQVGEARAFIEKALEAHKGKLASDGKDSATVEQELQNLLDSRARVFRAYIPVLQWYSGSNWQPRSRELYVAAGRLAKVLKLQDGADVVAPK